MHPVLANAIRPFAEQIAAVSLAEAQVAPNSDLNRWCGQQVVEHLILGFQKSTSELRSRLKDGEAPSVTGTLLQWIIKTQVCWFGSMSQGVPTYRSLYPSEFVTQDGPALASRFLAEAEELSKALADCRLVFGMRPCGRHPIYGPLRVEEWRVCHAVHCRHHLPQFKAAIDFARSHPELQSFHEPGIVRTTPVVERKR
jgi:hypothetical protein